MGLKLELEIDKQHRTRTRSGCKQANSLELELELHKVTAWTRLQMLFDDLSHILKLSTSELAPSYSSSPWSGNNSSLTFSVTLSVSDSGMSSSLLFALKAATL